MLTRLTVMIISQYVQISNHCCISETNIMSCQLYLHKNIVDLNTQTHILDRRKKERGGERECSAGGR